MRCRARRAAELLRERHGIIANAGVGEAGTDVASLAESYVDAKTAVRLGGGQADIEIREIADLRVQQLLFSPVARQGRACANRNSGDLPRRAISPRCVRH